MDFLYEPVGENPTGYLFCLLHTPAVRGSGIFATATVTEKPIVR